MSDNEAQAADGPAAAAEAAGCEAMRTAQHYAEELAAGVRKQPLLAVALAAGVGFILGCALRRS